MKNVVSFSGGRTSAYMVHLMMQYDPDTHFIYMDTGAEHPKTYEFIRNIVKHWGVNLTCLRVIPNPEMNKASTYEVLSVDQIGPDLEPWKRMVRKYGHPYVGGAFCTDRMKTVPFTKYCEEHFGKGNYMTWLGIRADEPKRLRPREGFAYLANISDFEKQDVLDWWAKQPFDLEIQEHLGNCVFCIKKSLQKVSLATKDEPLLAQEFITMLDENDIKEDKVMYRSNNTLSQVIGLFSDTERNELASRMRSMRQYDAGSCSESCEAFPTDGQTVSLIDQDIPTLIESPFDYSIDDDHVVGVGGDVYICEFNSKYYMSGFESGYYDGGVDTPWSWVEIDKTVYDTLKEINK